MHKFSSLTRFYHIKHNNFFLHVTSFCLFKHCVIKNPILFYYDYSNETLIAFSKFPIYEIGFAARMSEHVDE